MSRRLRVLVPLAAAAGIGGGALLSSALPEERASAGTPPVAAPSATARPAPAGPVRIAPARRPAQPPDVELRVRPGTLAIDARLPDPGGGPPWAVRVFEADRVTTPRARRPGVSPWIGRSRCAQLGRLVRGRFGWVDHERTWRPAGVAHDDAPMACGSAVARSRQALAQAVSTLRLGTTPGDAELVGTAVWGLAPAGSRAVLTAGSAPSPVTLGPRGGVLALLDPGAGPRDLRLEVAREGRAVPVSGLAPATSGPARRARRGSVRLAARAPDPAGGLPYGLLVSRGGNGICTVSGPRVVGERTGVVDLALGTFIEQPYGGGGCGATRPTRERPLQVSYSLGAGGPADAAGQDGERRARIERRTSPGRTIVAGIAHPDVRSVTIATPRDVRTLVPTSADRGFIAVYDGGFPTGAIVLTARLKDGGTFTERFVDAGL